MADNISIESSASMRQTAPTPAARSDIPNGTNGSKMIAKQAAKEPKVVITEVANKAASEKKHSLDSLDQIASDMREAITTLNAALEKTATRAVITKDEDLNRFVVRITDASSGEIVREIPSEALLKFARNLQELKGLIFDASL